jgi:hypothetical protein
LADSEWTAQDNRNRKAGGRAFLRRVAATFGLTVTARMKRPRRRSSRAALYGRQGFAVVKAGKPAEALAIFTGIDEKFVAAYAASPRVYCSHNSRESVMNMTRAAVDGWGVISIGVTWCDAIYFTAYSLVDLGRTRFAFLARGKGPARAAKRVSEPAYVVE